MSNGPFKLDEDGNLIGPGLFIPREQRLQVPALRAVNGVIVLTLEQLNALYGLGVQAGRLEEAAYYKRLKARTESVKITDAPEPPE